MKKIRILSKIQFYNTAVVLLVMLSALIFVGRRAKTNSFNDSEEQTLIIKNQIVFDLNMRQKHLTSYVDNLVKQNQFLPKNEYFELLKQQKPFDDSEICYQDAHIASSEVDAEVYFHFFADTSYSSEQFFSVVQQGVDPNLISSPDLSFKGLAYIDETPVVFSFISANRSQKFLFVIDADGLYSKFSDNEFAENVSVVFLSVEDEIIVGDEKFVRNPAAIFEMKLTCDSLKNDSLNNHILNQVGFNNFDDYYGHSYDFEMSNAQLMLLIGKTQISEIYQRTILFGLLLIFMFTFLIYGLTYVANWHVVNPLQYLVNNFDYPQELNVSTVATVGYIRKNIDRLQNQLSQYQMNISKNIKDQERITRDLDVAKKLQRNILPGDGTVFEGTGYNLYARSEFAYDIGGDLYDYFKIDDDHILMVVGDVAGKGIPASLYMVFTITILRSLSSSDLKVEEIANKLNERLFDESESDLFVTIFIGILNVKTGVLNYTNAAHCFPMLIKKEGSVERMTDTHGIPMGVYLKRKYTSSTLQLEEGDILFVYTDGVIDIKDENDMNYSEEVLRFNLMGTWFYTPKEIVSKIEDSITTFRGTMDPVDDVTMVALTYKPELKDSAESDDNDKTEKSV